MRQRDSRRQGKERRRTWPERACPAVLLVVLGLCSSCSKQTRGNDASKPPPPRAVPVTAATVAQRAVPVELKTFGAAESHATVAVKAEVGGALTTVHFKKGQEIKKGDLLFTIDPRPFEAALKQAEAALARDTAQLENTKKELLRDEALLKKGITAQSDYDKRQADVEALSAAVRSDNAAIDNAKLQLEHCFIRSPIDGRAGNLLVDQGNLIKANDIPLVYINQIRPIEVFFSVPEAELPRVKKYLAEGKVLVQAEIPNDPGAPEAGELTFVDNAVDKASGTIRLGAVFENKQERLWPGLYVNVTVALTVQKDALVAPARAVQTGQGNKYVVVIKPDSTVENRPVTVRRINEQEVVVEKGVQAGEQVVTDGHLRLTPGVKVTVQTEAERKGASPKAGPQKASTQGPASRGAQS